MKKWLAWLLTVCLLLTSACAEPLADGLAWCDMGICRAALPENWSARIDRNAITASGAGTSRFTVQILEWENEGLSADGFADEALFNSSIRALVNIMKECLSEVVELGLTTVDGKMAYHFLAQQDGVEIDIVIVNDYDHERILQCVYLHDDTCPAPEALYASIQFQ